MVEVKEIICKHDTVKENGFTVCVLCGVCVESDYFLLDQKELNSRNSQPFKHNENYIIETEKTKKFKASFKYNRLMKIDRSSKNTVSGYISLKTTLLLNKLSEFLNKKQLNELKNYIWNNEPKTVKDLFQSVFYYVDSMDLPILSSQLIHIIKQDTVLSSRIKIYRDIRRFKTIRTYYWYISKRISEIQQIPIEKHHEIFETVKEYYKIIRFRLLDSCNPIHLIDYLLYEAINQHFRHIPKEFRTLKKFNLTHFFKLDNKKYLMKLKRLKLDEKIALKLIFLFDRYNKKERE